MPKTKLLLIILIVLLIVVVGALVVFNFFLKKPPETARDQEIERGVLPGAPSSGDNGERQINRTSSGNAINIISLEAVVSPAVSRDKKSIVYYNQTNGNVYEADFMGQRREKISSSNIPDLLKVLWSKTKDDVITITRSPNGVQKSHFSYITGQATPLSPSVGFIDFSPDGKRIAYQYRNEFTGENTIAAADPDGSNFEVIINTRIPEWRISWVGENLISLHTPPSGLAEGSVYKLKPSDKSFTKVLGNKNGLNVNWSPGGEKILYSFTDSDGKNLQTAVADANGNNEKNLPFSTLAKKCIWSQNKRTVFCAVPRSVPARAIIPDDYYKGRVVFNDDLIMYNIETGNTTILLDEATLQENDTLSALSSLDVKKIFLSPTENFIFFVNGLTGRLYSLRLR